MQRETLPISEIQVIDRQRKDLGDIQGLSNSLQLYGLIQPIVVTQEKRLIAGGRRLAAATALGWKDISVVYRETLTDDELHELELEENLKRKSMTWTEETLTIAKIHFLKSQRSAIEGKSWGQRHAAELFGMQVGTVNYVLRVAKLLKDELLLPEDQRRAWKCDSASDAWRNVILVDEQDRFNAELARRAQESANKKKQETQELVDGFVKELDSTPLEIENKDRILELRSKARLNYLDLSELEARELYLSNKLNPSDKFDEYHKQKVSLLTEHFSIKLTDILIHGDSIEFMNKNEGRFDHVITDIPYGIDMDMLNQNNPHGEMKDIDSVLKEHDVDENMALMRLFFPAAFHCTKDSAFLITWCDIMQWQYMYDLAISAGWKVQRWPITWVKDHQCMNQSAQYNFTKSTEIALVCRKPRATLTLPASTCVISASNEKARRDYGHPFAKPHECWEFLITHVSIEGQTILEPFAGRGSGVIPILKLKRNVIGVEINEAHYNALLQNVQRHFLELNPNFIFK